LKAAFALQAALAGKTALALLAFQALRARRTGHAGLALQAWFAALAPGAGRPRSTL
jgi:hypothetical protein